MKTRDRKAKSPESEKQDEMNVDAGATFAYVTAHICLTSFPFISGLSTSHSSLKTANSESDRITERPKLQTKVMA